MSSNKQNENEKLVEVVDLTSQAFNEYAPIPKDGKHCYDEYEIVNSFGIVFASEYWKEVYDFYTQEVDDLDTRVIGINFIRIH